MWEGDKYLRQIAWRKVTIIFQTWITKIQDIPFAIVWNAGIIIKTKIRNGTFYGSGYIKFTKPTEHIIIIYLVLLLSNYQVVFVRYCGYCLIVELVCRWTSSTVVLTIVLVVSALLIVDSLFHFRMLIGYVIQTLR